MEKPLSTPKSQRRWQLGIYGITILFMVWDLLFTYPGDIFDDFKSYSRYFLLITFPLLSISWFLALKSPPLGARSAVVASTISLLAYLIFGFINLFNYQYYALDILWFYLLRIFFAGAVLIASYKILQFPAELLIPVLFFKLRWTSRIQKNVVLVFILIFGLLGSQWLYPRASCTLIGGRWARDGIAGQAQYCLHSYPDAGKACHSSDDCVGRCLVEINSSGVVPAVPTAGVCAPDNRAFGCFSFFEHQKISGACVD